MFARSPVTAEVQDWLIREFDWAIEAGILSASTPLVTPTDTYFAAPGGEAETVVRGLIADILKILGRGGDRIDILPIDRPNAELRAAGHLHNTSEVAGAFDGDDGAPVIFYDPEMVARPALLLATLTHELMHHVLHQYPEAQADDAQEELRTDVHMISAGFGIIAMMGAEEAGWFGYMRQPTRAHALAMFLRLRDIDADAVTGWLSGRMAKAVRKSYKLINNDKAFQALTDKMNSAPATT